MAQSNQGSDAVAVVAFWTNTDVAA